jgi:hypothetical protein
LKKVLGKGITEKRIVNLGRIFGSKMNGLNEQRQGRSHFARKKVKRFYLPTVPSLFIQE